MDVRARIVDAVLSLLGRGDDDGVTIAAVARVAKVSRPTVYAHFGGRDELIGEALRVAAVDMVQRVRERVGEQASAADHVVEMFVVAREEMRLRPALAPLLAPDGTFGSLRRDSLNTEAITLASSMLEPLVRSHPELAPHLDEVAETTIRFLLSVVWLDSASTSTDDALRGYLRRRLLPAIGVPNV